MTDTLRNFIREHIDDDVFQLVLSKSHNNDIDIRFAAEQIAARNKIKEKLPTWFKNDYLIYPSALTTEQCSSELTAKYKQQFIDKDMSLCDLTGGLGVDSYYFSQKAKHVTYVERNEKYCEAARQNFTSLNAENISIINGEAETTLHNVTADVFYLDPSRRSTENKRVFAIEDCEPDLTKLWSFFKEKHSKKVIVKLSPMLDIKQTLSQLSDISEIHVVSVKNDCKELLLVASFENNNKEPEIHCTNFTSGDSKQIFKFRLSEENATIAPIANNIEKYLYEPNASVLKAGAYKTVASRFNLKKLSTNSHLYTSDNLEKTFVGRIFKVVDVYPFCNRLCKDLSAKIPKANISTRNFTLSANELHKRMHIDDGGDVYLFATTMANNKKVIIHCHALA